jgi:hypothetical protein
MVWGTKIWGYLLNGLEVPWIDVIKKGSGHRSQDKITDPEIVTNLKEFYKYLGYMTSQFTVDQAVAAIDPHRPKSEERPHPIENYAMRVLVAQDPGHPDYNMRITESEFADQCARYLFRELIEKDLMKFGEWYNPNIQNMNLLETKPGPTISREDVEAIENLLLEEISEASIVRRMYKKFGKDFKPIFTHHGVKKMLARCGLITGKASFKQVGVVVGEGLEKAAWINRGH